jgi:ribosomal protein L37AE/L43A
MPTCPNCGDEFPRGGAYSTHVKNCDADPGGESDDLRSTVDNLRGRINRMEKEMASMPSSDEFDTIWTALMDPNGRVPSNSRLRDYEDALEELSEVKEELDKFTDDCPSCGVRIPVPHAPGKYDCPSCGEALNWGADDIPTFEGRRGGERVRTTR